MKKRLLQLFLGLCLCTGVSNAMAIADSFYASGEDLDYMYESSENLFIKEIENKLRRFVIYRKLEDLLFDFNDDYPGISQ